MKRSFKIFILLGVVAALSISGCATNQLAEKDIWRTPQVGQQAMQAAAASKEPDAGKRALELLEGKTQAVNSGPPFHRLIVPMNRRHFVSEGMYGLNYEMYWRKDEKRNELGKESRLGIKFLKNGQPYLMFLTLEPLDMNRQVYISTRSGKHQYSVDSKLVFGELEDRFDWDKLKSLSAYGFQSEMVMPGTPDYTDTMNMLAVLTQQIKDKHIPDLLEKILRKIGKISSDDITIGFDMSSVYMFVGIRAWFIVEAIVQKADLKLPYYDTAYVTQDYLGKVLETMNQVSGEDQEAIKEWQDEMRAYKARKAEYDRQYGDLLN